MQWEIGLASIVVGYLFGCISFTRIVSRALAPDLDVEHIEVPMAGTDKKYHFSSMGATTASIALGPRAGCLISILDMLKAFVPTLAFRLLFPGQYYALLVSLGAVAGHNWPVFYRFQGGRGMSPTYGSLLAVDWLGVFASALGGMVLGFLVLRDFVLAYVAGIWLIIPWLWFRTRDAIYLIYAVLLNMLFMLAMIPEFKVILEARKAGPLDMRTVMEATPMGRGMLKVMKWLGKQDTPPRAK